MTHQERPAITLCPVQPALSWRAGLDIGMAIPLCRSSVKAYYVVVLAHLPSRRDGANTGSAIRGRADNDYHVTDQQFWNWQRGCHR